MSGKIITRVRERQEAAAKRGGYWTEYGVTTWVPHDLLVKLYEHRALRQALSVPTAPYRPGAVVLVDQKPAPWWKFW